MRCLNGNLKKNNKSLGIENTCKYVKKCISDETGGWVEVRVGDRKFN